MQPSTFYYHIPHSCSQNVSNNSSFPILNALYTSSAAFNNAPVTPVSAATYGPTIIQSPASTVMPGTSPTTSWAHTVPTLMPWVPKDRDATSESVMRFTAPFPPDPCTSQTATSWELLNNLGANVNTNANLHLKRRSDTEGLEIGPQKQFITEEKMAARMRELHISNHYSVPQESSPFGPFGSSPEKSEKPIKSLRELESMLADNSNGKNMPYKGSVILAPEIKSLVEPEKLFAKTIIEEIQRPTMAVVLWQPPQGSVKNIMNSSSNSQTHSSHNSEDNFDNNDERAQEANNNAYIPRSIINSSKPLIGPQRPSSHISFSSDPNISYQEDTDVVMDM